MFKLHALRFMGKCISRHLFSNEELCPLEIVTLNSYWFLTLRALVLEYEKNSTLTLQLLRSDRLSDRTL